MTYKIMQRCELIPAPSLSKCFISKDGFSFSESARATILSSAIIEVVSRVYNVVHTHERLYCGDHLIAGMTSSVCETILRQQLGTSRSDSWMREYIVLATKTAIDTVLNIFREYRHWPETHENYRGTGMPFPVAFDHSWSFKILPPRKLKTGGYTPRQIAITYPVVAYGERMLSVNAFVKRYAEKNVRKRDRALFYEELMSVAAFGWVDDSALTTIKNGVK